MRYPKRLLGLTLFAAALSGCDEGTSPQGETSTVTIRVYVDRDGSATFTPDDAPVAQAAVVLTPNTGGETLQATSDAAGLATFAGVKPGSYTATLANTGLPAGAVYSGGSSLVIRTPFEGAEIEREFRLEHLPATISGVVFRDNDNSNSKTAADTPAVGFTVNLYAGTTASGTPAATSTTDATGAFSFGLLRPGSYTVEIVPPVSTVTFPGGPTRTLTLAADQAAPLEVKFEGVLLVSIARALSQPLGSPVVVEGVVTAAQGVFNARSVYIQDRTGGVQVFGVPTGGGLVLGDSLRVTGTRAAFSGQPQIGSPTVEKLGKGTVPAAVAQTGAQINALTREGQLVRAQNVTVTAVSGSATSTSYNVTVRDAAGTSFIMRVSGSGVAIPRTYWTVGGRYNVTGLLGSFNRTAQLLPRSQSDVARIDIATPIQQAKQLAAGTDVTVTGVVTAGTAQLFSAFYLQDATSGVMVFTGSSPATPVAPGDSISVTGRVGAFNGEVQLTGTLIVVVHKKVTALTPRTITGAQVAARTYEGELVRVENATVTAVSGSATSTSYNVTVRAPDGTSFTVRVSGSSVAIPRTTWTVGSRYSVTGVLGSFRGTAQLKPRSLSDVSAT